MTGLSMLALVTDAFGGRGGIAQYNRDLMTAVAEIGSISLVALPRHAPEAVVTPQRVKQLPARPGRLGYALAAIREAMRRPVDVVFSGHLFMAPLAAIIARLKRAKLVIQMHGIEAWPKPSALCRSAVESADLVLCVSRHTRAAVLGWAAVAPERVIVLPNTVSDSFSPGDGSALRAGWGLQHKRVLLTVGRLESRERYKGHDRVIAALPDLVRSGHDTVYVVLGEGDDRGRLEVIAGDLGVDDRVLFKGATAADQLVEAYRMADLFVMPSTGEGFGIVFLEAMASGTPAVGLALAGARDALADGELGIAAAEGDLAAALGDLLGAPKPDPHVLAAVVRTRFGREAFANRLGLAVDRLLSAA